MRERCRRCSVPFVKECGCAKLSTIGNFQFRPLFVPKPVTGSETGQAPTYIAPQHDSTYLEGMSKKRVIAWEVRRFKASSALYLGRVYAPDEKTALKVAIKELAIRSPDQNRPLIRRES
jgi:hypothetical protein